MRKHFSDRVVGVFANSGACGHRRRVESVRRCGRPRVQRRRVRQRESGHRRKRLDLPGVADAKTGSVQEKLDSAVETVISRATKLVNATEFPVLVFDGARIAHKKETHAKRAGATGEKIERCYLPQILNEVRKRGFVYVVAPNESDHQLKYMESSGLFDFVLTDDTDAVVLGCAKVVHKVCWSVSTLKCNVYNRSNVARPVDTNVVKTVVDLMRMHGDAAVRL